MTGRPSSTRASTADAREQVAADLGGPVAFLVAEQGIYFARPAGPFSPVLRLLRGIYELEPQCARFIARNTVHTTATVTASCAGAVKVAGRTLRPVAARDHGLTIDVRYVDAGAAVPRPRRASPGLEEQLAARVDRGAHDDAGLVALASRLAAAVKDLTPAGARWDRPIAALLADADGRVLDWATSTASSNATGHAEINLVERAVARGGLPAGSTVVSSLKPCKMCAGLLWDVCPDRQTLRVLFAEDDPGRAARETVLEPGTMARRAHSGPRELRLRPQTQPVPAGGIARA